MNNLKLLRKEKKLTTRELGEKTLIAYPSITRMENNERPMTQENLIILCEFFGVSTDYMLGRTSERNPETKLTSNFSFAMHGLNDDLTDENKEMLLNLAKKLANKE